MDKNYAFIGLGAMGYGMASNIRQKMPSSSVLFIYDVYAPTCDKFVAEFNHFGRIEIAQSVKEAAEKTKIIISSLPNTAAVRAVYLDEAAGCIAAPDDPARLILECSTIGATEAREIAERLAAAKAGHYVDSPASGGTPAAVGGRLSFMIGHTEPQLSDPIGIQMQNTLKMMGDAQKLFWCGKTGDGLAAKISNNYIACSVFLIVEEALAIGGRAGIDPNTLRQVIHNSSGQTFMGDIISSAPRSQLMGRNGFPTEIMVKDLSLAVNAGSELGITPKMALAALAIWKEAAKDSNVLNIGGFFQTNQ